MESWECAQSSDPEELACSTEIGAKRETRFKPACERACKYRQDGSGQQSPLLVHTKHSERYEGTGSAVNPILFTIFCGSLDERDCCERTLIGRFLHLSYLSANAKLTPLVGIWRKSRHWAHFPHENRVVALHPSDRFGLADSGGYKGSPWTISYQ